MRNIAQPTRTAFPNGTITLKSRMSVAGTGLPTSVQPPHRPENAARLLVDRHVAGALLQRRGELRRDLVDDHLPQVHAPGLHQRDNGGIHHRFENRDRLVGDTALEHHRRHLGDAVAREDAANRQHRREKARYQQADGYKKQGEDQQATGAESHAGIARYHDAAGRPAPTGLLAGGRGTRDSDASRRATRSMDRRASPGGQAR